MDYDPTARMGRRRATTAHTTVTVLVTAEADAQAASPSDVVVARQEVAGED